MPKPLRGSNWSLCLHSLFHQHIFYVPTGLASWKSNQYLLPSIYLFTKPHYLPFIDYQDPYPLVPPSSLKFTSPLFSFCPLKNMLLHFIHWCPTVLLLASPAGLGCLFSHLCLPNTSHFQDQDSIVSFMDSSQATPLRKDLSLWATPASARCVCSQ